MKILFLLMVGLFNCRSYATMQIPLEPEAEPPALLSATGLFQQPLADLKPAAQLMAYEINQALWVDYAKKKRWVYLPLGTTAIFHATEPWTLPAGTILVKHFSMEISKGLEQKIETRLLIRKKGDPQKWEGYTYRWQGAEALLVGKTESPVVELTVDASAVGGARRQQFKIPSRQNCLDCHNSSVGYVRSLRTHQLNQDAPGENQLRHLERAGFFAEPLPPLDTLAAFARIDDHSKPASERVKSYLDVNCAHCHNPDEAAMCSFTGLDLQFKNLDLSKLIDGYYIKAGHPANSELFKRMNSTQARYRMPYIGSSLIDPTATAVISEWIGSLEP